MYVQNGNVVMDDKDIDYCRTLGFTVDMHTSRYANHIGVYAANGETVGFHCWTDNLEFYVGDEHIAIQDNEHLNDAFDMMIAIRKFGLR